ncbi:ABC transporter substrate-binding protein [Frankia sp. AgB32]|uniref:ABC transporter substrate-binding protein n=1 Tax=Frankia sp. AgB32 TaxID=631119 RepID=UPI00200CAB84|nr:ABC transporter substrate-binding protein [Frankia sp. AgB32]MCK9894513.1 ABC transporter substrate-binding protein [Frankia sp. AgB32]
MAAVGCSSSDTPATPACSSPGVTQNEIKAGLLLPDSGPLASGFLSVRSAIDARFGVTNAAGGVHGRKITLEWRDDRGSTVANYVGARDLVEQQHVFGLLETSLTASGSAQYLADQGVPVSGLAIEKIWSQYRNMFSFVYDSSAAVDTYGQFVKSQGGTRAVIVQPALSAGLTNPAAQYYQSLEAAGIPILNTLNFNTSTDSIQGLAAKVIALGPDTVVSMMGNPETVQLLNLLRSAGKNPKVMISSGGYDQQLLRTYGPQVAGIITPVFHLPFEAGGPAIDAYSAAMARYAPQITQPNQDIAVLSYIVADTFVRGLEAAGDCPTRQSFINGLRSVTNYDAGGLISPVNFKTNLGRPVTCYTFVQVNPTGTGYNVMGPQLCGKEIAP